MKKFDVESVIDLYATKNDMYRLIQTHCENQTDVKFIESIIDAIDDLLIHIGEMDYPVE